MKSQPSRELTPEELSSLGKTLTGASEQPDESTNDALFLAMERRLASGSSERVTKPPARMRLSRTAVGAAVGMLSVAASVLFVVTRPSDLDFTVRGGEVVEGDYVRHAQASTPTHLRFSEGTEVEFSPGSRGRLLSVTPQGAEFLLEQGKLALEVVPNRDGAWDVAAGPFDVEVTGTVFSVEWEALSEHLRVDVQRGSVRVRGPDADGVQVRAGQSFQAWLGPSGRRTQALAPLGEAEWIHPSTIHGDRAHQPSGASIQNASPEQAARGKAVPPEDVTRKTSQEVTTSSGGKSWAQQVAAGDYSQVVGAAEARGIEQVLGTATRGELMALADAARYSKRSDLAERTLRRARARFAGSRDAAAAAFLLGRLVESRNPGEAKTLYNAATQEDPNGPFRGEILGRRMLLSERTGDRLEAKRMAQEYVTTYPKGPYAEKARLMATDQ